MSDTIHHIREALAQAAAVHRKGDNAAFITNKLPVNASRNSIETLRLRIIAFLQNVPEGMTAIDILDDLQMERLHDQINSESD